ncbi:MAG TPA: PhzF family phenazine biosynthesis protein [Candidatus Dormibacteraeota bacterium]
MERRFSEVDVFTDRPYFGNPLAVVIDADELSTDEMQRFAAWTNLSETTFLLPPSREADYRVRIFTPVGELPFAGHPTLGSCHVWLESGGQPKVPDRIIQECGAGLITIHPSGGRLAFSAPPLIRSGPVESTLLEQIVAAAGIDARTIVDAEWVDNGPGWVGVLLDSAHAVLALRPGFLDLDLGVVGPYPPGSPQAFEVRAFFPKQGSTVEDPVTGSLNASLAQWLVRTGRAKPPYIVSQGTVLGRAGRVHITMDATGIWVGGQTITCVSGTVEL